jgi:hypothetical protein
MSIAFLMHYLLLGGYLMDDAEKKVKYLTESIKLAAKLSVGLKTKEGELLPTVRFTENGKGFYYSITSRFFVWVDRGLEWYYIPFIDKDEQDRVCLYSPYIFASAVFIMVPVDEIEIVGFN